MTAAADRTPTRILDAAAATLRRDPGASIETIASVAEISRATVHRHFASRDALLEALRSRALEEISAVFHRAKNPDIPLLVRLYQVSVDLVSAKADWHWALGEFEYPDAAADPDPSVASNPVLGLAVEWMADLARGGLLEPGVDQRWAATLYLTIIRAAAVSTVFENRSPATRASHAADAFLNGIGVTSVRYVT